MWHELVNLNRSVKKHSKGKSYFYGRFLPNTEVIFIAERPTKKGKRKDCHSDNVFYVSKSDKKFVALLNKHGLGGSYITDIIKTCAKAGASINGKSDNKFYELLNKEVGIISPKIIVALGNKASEKLCDLRNSGKLDWPRTVKVEKIWHPAYVQRYNKWSKYEKQIEILANLCLKHKNIET